jgi:hypothetical protein
MSTYLDIIVSMIFGASLFAIMLQSNDIATETQMVCNGDMMVQQMLTSTVQLVEGELRNVGFGVPGNQSAILEADAASLTFLTDIGRDGTIDTVRYFTGSTEELTVTQNEIDRYLKRSIRAGETMTAGVVTVFNLRYFTQSGDLFATPVPANRLSEIYTIELTIEVQSPVAPLRDPATVAAGERNALYSSSLWQQTRLASQNNRR